jgi:hypothetical protein
MKLYATFRTKKKFARSAFLAKRGEGFTEEPIAVVLAGGTGPAGRDPPEGHLSQARAGGDRLNRDIECLVMKNA